MWHKKIFDLPGPKEHLQFDIMATRWRCALLSYIPWNLKKVKQRTAEYFIYYNKQV